MKKNGLPVEERNTPQSRVRRTAAGQSVHADKHGKWDILYDRFHLDQSASLTDDDLIFFTRAHDDGREEADTNVRTKGKLPWNVDFRVDGIQFWFIARDIDDFISVINGALQISRSQNSDYLIPVFNAAPNFQIVASGSASSGEGLWMPSCHRDLPYLPLSPFRFRPTEDFQVKLFYGGDVSPNTIQATGGITLNVALFGHKLRAVDTGD